MKSFLSSAALLIVLFTASASSAQTMARVTRDQATIWRPGFATVAAIVQTGTELVVVAKRGTWYEVVLPNAGVAGGTGLIAQSQVEIISGPAPPEEPLVSPAAVAQRPTRTTRPLEPRYGVRAFGNVGFQWYLAHETFSAIFGQPGGLQYGGGVEVRAGGIFVMGAIEQFHRNGERAFQFDGQAFRLGIDDTVDITSIAATVGYRIHGRTVNPYVGGGLGTVRYSEHSDFSTSADDVDDHFSSYHALAGIEWRGRNPWLGVAFEVQYTHVPNALNGGLAAALDEHNLGGVEARIKIELGK